MAEKKQDKRVRNYACVVYPESAPENWQAILEMHFVPAYISPLHENDVDPQNQPKKPHHHVMIMFDGKKTMEQAKEIFDSIGGVGCEIVKSIRGYARYLCHLDNPEKAQYDPSLVRCIGGCDYISTIGLALDKYTALGEMMLFCDEHNILSFAVLAKYAKSNEPGWFRCLCDSGTVFMREFIKSRSWSVDAGNYALIDEVTGEIICD